MPATSFEPQGPLPPGVQLSNFVDNLWGVMSDVMKSPGLVDEGFRARMLAVSPEVEDAAGSVAKELETGPHDDALAEVGLAGRQLDLKLFGYYRSLERLRRIWEAPGPLDRLPPSDWSKVRRVFLDVLGWGNRLLSSILAAIPGLPGAEVLKEAKEAIEGALEDAELDAELGS